MNKIYFQPNDINKKYCEVGIIHKTYKMKNKECELIIDEVINYFDVDIFKNTRKRAIVSARQICIYYIRKNVKISSSKIGLLFPSKESKSGFLDHATVLHSVKTVENLIDVDPYYKQVDNDLKGKIKDLVNMSRYEIDKKYEILEIGKILINIDLKKIKRIHEILKKYEN